MSIGTSKHSIVATSVGGLAFDVAVRGHTLATDQTARTGGADAAPTPLELMGAALAACVALYARKYCIAQGIDGDDIAVEVKPVWREDPGRVGRYDVTVHLPAAFPPEHREPLMAMASDCPVHHTLTHTPEVAFRVDELEGVAG